jgi:ABC-type nickel/cobalt efflux system permease component RcnA
LSLLAVACLVPAAEAHPVGLGIYERTIEVRLAQDRIIVHYRLELTDLTAVKDLLAVGDGKELARLTKPQEHYEAFTRVYAPIPAANLTAQLDGKDLEFQCVHRTHEVLDHLRCDFVFEAPCTLRPGRRYQLTFREDNYDREAGMVRLTLVGGPSFLIEEKNQPDEALRAKSYSELKPGEEARARKASAAFAVIAEEPKGPAGRGPAEPLASLKLDASGEPLAWLKPESSLTSAEVRSAPPVSTEPSAPLHGDDGLLRLFLNSERGFWVMLLLAAGLGGAHALTPGHGKTLVAAYLVGQRGTVWHALLLGLVTTLTHTGIVLVLAVALRLYFPHGLTADAQRRVDTILGLIGGALIAGLGAWLLFRRLTGKADHFHLPGHGHPHHSHDHHHGHDTAGHYHDEHGHAHPLPTGGGVGGLIVLGVQGGIVPCWDAVVLLLAAVAMNLLWLALPLLLAFSAGLAGVLIAIGIVVVQARGLAGVRWGESRLFRALPLLSALTITGLGLWLCYDRLHPHAAPPGPPPQRVLPFSP